MLAPNAVTAMLNQLKGRYWLITALLYGCGFLMHEPLSLRIKDLDLQNHSIFIVRGKGRQDRYTLLPAALVFPIQHQIRQHFNRFRLAISRSLDNSLSASL
ncbi:tyrosine-type recombinase/integrase [Gilvimarinus agarilyticus]|uniref:tyrosine-type recombinase/integrase n=1 Tax=Gilvimarinus agarilyticus TaxID=679259 RepID=UPI0018DBE8C9